MQRSGTTSLQLSKKRLKSLGFVVNMEKSLCKATQRIEYLGFIIDLETMTFKLPKAKMKEIKQECRKLLQVQQVSVHQIAHMVGVLAIIATAPVPLHYHVLQRLKNRSLSIHNSYELKVRESIRSDLVDYPSWDKQQKNNSPTRIRPGDQIRCLQWGLGSMLQWLLNKGTVVKAGSNSTRSF